MTVRIDIEIPAISVEYLRTSLLSDLGMSGQPVEGALLPLDQTPEAADWSDGEWDDTDVRWLYSGGLAPGVYALWVRITGAGGVTPVRTPGLVLLT